jgi:uncharacterized protein (DUF1501 family)
MDSAAYACSASEAERFAALAITESAMLRILGTTFDCNCQGISRRELLRVGSLGAGLLALPQLLALKAAGSQASGLVQGKSVVLLFLSGGPPHIELFDPKMSAPAEIRSITGEVPSTLPGITLGGTFPKLAAMLDKLALIRSFGSKNAGHTYDSVTVAGNPAKAAMSAIYSRLAGTNNRRSGMPTNILVKPEAVQDGLKLDGNFETDALPTLTTPGQLGKTYEAFDPSGGGALKEDLQLSISPARLADRRELLAQLDQVRRRADETRLIDRLGKYQQQAFDMIARGIVEAFDLGKEDPRTLARYDTSGLFHAPDLQRYYDMRRASNQLGRQMLLARRLCEAGCGFVTVSDCGWDYHANSNSPKGMAGIWPMGQQVDHAVSAFVNDVQERGLADKILLVVTGEMGRTPRINKNGGRDHYGELTSLLVAGGGLAMGQVIGQSDRTASQAATEAYDPRHLFGTVMHTLFDVGQLRLDPSVPTDLSRAIAGSERIEPLFL